MAVVRAFPASCPTSVEDFFRLSRRFAEESGLITPDVRTALDGCDGESIAASMTMIGNGIFAYGTGAERVLSGYGEVFKLDVAPLDGGCCRGSSTISGGTDD